MSKKLQKLGIENFKRFPSLEIPLHEKCLVIMGANGTGKTQLLYALLLYFRAHNLHFPESSAHYSKLNLPGGEKVDYLDLRLTASALLHPSFAESKDWSHFIHSGKEATLTGTFDDGSSVSSILQANGVFYLLPGDAKVNVTAKILFAFMGIDFHFSSAPEDSTDPMTSNFGHIRFCFVRLSSEVQAEITKHMKTFFPSLSGIHGVRHEDDPPELTFTEQLHDREKTMNPAAMGSAFQKIFATLVLLYTLLRPRKLKGGGEEPFQERYFLMEEPEALLYPSLVVPFFSLLRRLCEENTVSFVVVSNSPDVWNEAPARVMLSSTEPKIIDEPIAQELESV